MIQSDTRSDLLCASGPCYRPFGTLLRLRAEAQLFLVGRKGPLVMSLFLLGHCGFAFVTLVIGFAFLRSSCKLVALAPSVFQLYPVI